MSILILYYPDDVETAVLLQKTLAGEGIEAELWNFMKVYSIDRSAFIIPLVVRPAGPGHMFTYDGYFFCLKHSGELPAKMLVVKPKKVQLYDVTYPIASYARDDFTEVVSMIKSAGIS